MLEAWIIFCSLALVGAILFWGDCDGGQTVLFNSSSPAFEDDDDNDCCCCLNCDYCDVPQVPRWVTLTFSGVIEPATADIPSLFSSKCGDCDDFNDLEIEMQCCSAHRIGACLVACKYTGAFTRLCGLDDAEYYIENVDPWAPTNHGQYVWIGDVGVSTRWTKFFLSRTYTIACDEVKGIPYSHYNKTDSRCDFRNATATVTPHCEAP